MELNRIMDIFAYYLSEYDLDAFKTLGYNSQSAGFDAISSMFGKKSSYLRRLRDEYDVVTNSNRKGQRNRAPRARIEETARYLSFFSFDELTDMVKALVDNAHSVETVDALGSYIVNQPDITEEELESILNAKDPTATILIRTGTNKTRVYKTAIISQLKRLYQGRCQLCGSAPFAHFDVDICEAHHIDHFASSQNNDAANIIILCPNHHRLIHKLNPRYLPEERCFEYPDGTREEIRIDYIR